MTHDRGESNGHSLVKTGLTAAPSTPGSDLECGPFSGDCSPRAPRNTRTERGTSACRPHIHAAVSKQAENAGKTSPNYRRNTFFLAGSSRVTPRFGSTFSRRRDNPQRGDVGEETNKKKQQKPTIKKILVVLVLTILLNPTPSVCGDRGREVWK